MRNGVALLASALVGALVAAGVFWATGSPGSDVPTPRPIPEAGIERPAPSDERVGRVRPRPPRAPDRRVRDGISEDIVAENEELRREIEALRDNLAALAGAALPWPEDLDDAYRPGAMRSHIEQVLADYRDEVELVDLDCAEFPCVAILQAVPGVDWMAESSTSQQAFFALAEGMPDEPALLISKGMRDDGEGEPIQAAAVALLSTQLDDDGNKRLSYRLETLMRSVE